MLPELPCLVHEFRHDGWAWIEMNGICDDGAASAVEDKIMATEKSCLAQDTCGTELQQSNGHCYSASWQQALVICPDSSSSFKLLPEQSRQSLLK